MLGRLISMKATSNAILYDCFKKFQIYKKNYFRSAEKQVFYFSPDVSMVHWTVKLVLMAYLVTLNV